MGSRLENAVYLHLRRSLMGARDSSISYYATKAGHEVDFIVGASDLDHVSRLLQVTADMSDPATREREVRALDEAMAETGLSESTIVTLRESDTIRVGSGTIRVVPAWEWMLGLTE